MNRDNVVHMKTVASGHFPEEFDLISVRRDNSRGVLPPAVVLYYSFDRVAFGAADSPFLFRTLWRINVKNPGVVSVIAAKTSVINIISLHTGEGLTKTIGIQEIVLFHGVERSAHLFQIIRTNSLNRVKENRFRV